MARSIRAMVVTPTASRYRETGHRVTTPAAAKSNFYVIKSSLNLWNNFTCPDQIPSTAISFISNPVNGDQFHRRMIASSAASDASHVFKSQFAGLSMEIEIGVREPL